MRLAPPLLLAWSVNAAVAPPPSEEAAAAGPLKFGRIALRDATVGPVPRAECLDSASADNESPLKTSQCCQNKTTQLFSYDPKHHFLVLQTTNCVGGAPCCVENWQGECTVFSCSDMSDIKAWEYSNTSGHISNGGQCMTASGSGGGVKVRV